MSSALGSLLRGSALLLIGNALSGMLNYAFQIQAAAGLSPVEYGKLNLWMAYTGIALSIGAVIQIRACFAPSGRETLRRFCALALPASIALPSCAWLALKHGDGSSSESFLLAAAGASFLGGVLFHSLLGQFQARTWFAGMGAATLLLAVVKIAGSSLAPNRPESYYLALSASFAAGCALLAGVGFFSARGERATRSARQGPRAIPVDAPLGALSDAPAEAHLGEQIPVSRPSVRWRQLAGSGLLALTLALAPQVDFLNLSASQPAEVLGRFAQTALFAKGIYFGALTLLQITLPLHLRSARGEAGAPSASFLRRIELGGLTLCAAGSVLLAAIGPELAKRFLGMDLRDARPWVLLSCLSLTALFRQVQQVQLDCALGRLPEASIRVGVIVAWMLSWRLAPTVPVEAYLLSSLAFYLALDGASWLLSRRRSA